MVQDEIYDIEFNEDKETLRIVASIAPLPANIVPSERFVRETRDRLLQLNPPKASRAA